MLEKLKIFKVQLNGAERHLLVFYFFFLTPSIHIWAFLKLIDGKAGDTVFFPFLCLTRQLDLIIF